LKFSYSRVGTFGSCPRKYQYQYIDHLKTIPETNADNALYLGLALHKGIETGSVDEALVEYKSHYNIIEDEHINWMIQLEYQIPRVLDILPPGGEHEIKIETDQFVGFIDYVVGDTIYDFKFSNNKDNYLTSPQLSIYKYYLQKIRPELTINHLKYVFVPKVNIRQKLKAKIPETLFEFRLRLQQELGKTNVEPVEVEYDETSVTDFLQCCKFIEDCRVFPKNETNLCNWCSFKEYCQSNEEIDYMILR
jgi:hypothetical protein